MVGSDASWQERSERFRAVVSAANYARLWRQAAWLTICREDAEDLIQETLAAAFQRLHQLRDAAQALPWMMAIMRRRFLNMERARRRQQAHAEKLQEQRQHTGPVMQNHGPGHEPHSEIVRESLLRLRPDQRWILTMHYIENATMQELSSALSLSETAVRKRLSRARRELRALLDLQGGGMLRR